MRLRGYPNHFSSSFMPFWNVDEGWFVLGSEGETEM